MTAEQIRSANLPTTRGEQIRLPARLNDEGEMQVWDKRIADPNEIVALDLFCGAGGMSLGLEDAGLFVAAGIDANTVACETHAYNLLSKTMVLDLGDVRDPATIMRELKIPRVDVIVGGPPCQGFSIAGRNKLRSLAEQDPQIRQEVDRKNRLYKEFVDFVRVLQPLIFVMENVPHLGTYGQGVIANEIRQDFEQLGYLVEDFTLDASDFGVPQTRKRLFFVGRLKNRGLDSCKPRPEFGRKMTLRDAIGDLPEVGAPSLEEILPYDPSSIVGNHYQMWMRSRMCEEELHIICDHIVRPVRDDDREIFRNMAQGHRYYDVPPEYRRYDIKSFGDKYYKLRWDVPCHTITAHMDKDGYRYIHPEQLRTLSVREAARVQSFPDHFRFAGHRSNRYRQIGNAVPPLLARAIGRAVRRAIERHRQSGVFDFRHGQHTNGNGLQAFQPGLLGFESMTMPVPVVVVPEVEDDVAGNEDNGSSMKIWSDLQAPLPFIETRRKG